MDNSIMKNINISVRKCSHNRSTEESELYVGIEMYNGTIRNHVLSLLNGYRNILIARNKI